MPTTPTNLSQYYASQGTALPTSASARFADPNFAAAAGRAGYNPASYAVNAGNASANNAILSQLLSGSGTSAPASTPTTAPTIAQAYNIPTQQEDPSLTSARTSYETFLDNQSKGTPVVDEAAIRANTLANFQAEVDATNAIYAEKLRQAKITGAGRVGSGTAIQARRGLLGSDFGNAQTDRINTDNDAIYGGINAEKGAAVNAILAASRKQADETIAAKTKAIGEGLDAHLKFLSESGTRKTTNATAAAKFIYAQKLSPKDLSPTEIDTTAKNYGVSKEDIINAYTDVKKEGDATAAKLALDTAKEKNASLPASAQEYEYAKANGYKGTYGQYQNEDANRKALINRAGSGTASTLSERNQQAVEKVSTLFSPGYLIPGSGGVPFVDQNGFATVQGFKEAIKAAGIPRNDFIKSFGYLLVPGSESEYGITGAEKKLITGVAPE